MSSKYNSLSKIFRPFNIPPKNSKIFRKIIETDEYATPSRGFKMLQNYGYVQKALGTGYSYLLPMGQRVVDKIIRIVDREMTEIGAEKMSLPMLTPKKLWENTEMYEKTKDEIFNMKERNGMEFILSPTHEQSMCHFMSQNIMSYKHFPVLLYQIGSKFRDEHKPKLGNIRSKEFIMKDLYSFDINEEAANETYQKVTEAYSRIFYTLRIPFNTTLIILPLVLYIL